jgi:hypothetical protein
MKTLYIGILILILLAGAGYIYTTLQDVGAKSTLIIAVKDLPKVSKFGEISSLSLSFSEVSVHKASAGETVNDTTQEMTATESNETGNAGWITVVDEVQTVDLLQFTDVSKVLGEKLIDPGKYTQMRLKIDSGSVTIDGETYDLTIPSRSLKLNRGFWLESGAELKLTLDFNVIKSLVKTGKDKYKLKPVIKVISETPTTITPSTSTLTVTSTLMGTTIPEGTTVSGTTVQGTTVPTETEGILVMKIKDKLDLTNITAIDLTIDKVWVHKAYANEGENDSNETFETNDTSNADWITVVDETKTYNLLELVDTPGEVMGTETLSPGRYTQIRLSVTKAELILNNETYDIKIPSKRFYWVRAFYIEAGSVTTITLDFDADDSVKQTGSNKFILKPTVKIISEITATTTTTTTTESTTTIMNVTTTIPNVTTTTVTNLTTTIPNVTTSTTTLTTTTIQNVTTMPENTTTTIA